MFYRPFGNKGFDVSTFGMGLMRLPTQADGKIDRAEAIAMIRYALDHGVNYLDTAYPYHGGESELVLAEALKDGYRQKAIVVSKSPTWLLKEPADYDRLLDEQLEKLGVDYLDVYLLHSLGEENFAIAQKMDYKAFIQRAKAAGKIKYAGFSFHGDFDCFKRIVDDYDFDVCQIQLNILDENEQATVEGLKYAAAKGMPVIIMEPLKGGRLASKVPAEAMAALDAVTPGRSSAEWAFKWVYNFPEVTVILSGVSTMDQLKDNLRIFQDARPGILTEAENTALHQLKAVYESRMKVGCTGCEYCMPCPQGVQIPQIFSQYNDASVFDELEQSQRGYAKLIAEQHDASQCVGCGACEGACPQSLSIIELLKQADAALRG
ncbi:MAG: aldo/keto reductase [Christensenellales bacterium]|jgi:predicted aldo/keto reductase-like oxidoreductase